MLMATARCFQLVLFIGICCEIIVAQTHIDLLPPTNKQETVKSVSQTNGECVWYRAPAASGADVAENAVYTVSVSTPADNYECAPGAWFVVGVPRQNVASGGSTFSSYCPFQNPRSSKAWMKDMSVVVEYCMTQQQEIWLGFNNNCSTDPLEATIRVSMSNFCDQEKKSFFTAVFWLVVVAGFCCLCCTCMLCYRFISKRHEDQNALAMGFSIENGTYTMKERNQGQFLQGEPGEFGSQGDERPMGIRIGVRPNSGAPVSTKEWEMQQKQQRLKYDQGDEENRLKAMRWERKREEKRLNKLKEDNDQAAEENEAWERVAGDRQAEVDGLEGRRRAAVEAEAAAKAAAKRAEEAAARKPKNTGDAGDSKILKDAAADIKKAVEEAYQLPANERKKKLRDLRMRWHPDKNPMLKSLADEISKIINCEIERVKAIHGE